MSTGKNLPVTPDQIKQGLGGNFLSQLAGKAGVLPDAVSTQLSHLLDDVIDKLTRAARLKPAGSTSCSRCFRGKWERNFRQIDKKLRLSYGRNFLVTFSKPVQRKSAEDNPVATPECEAV